MIEKRQTTVIKDTQTNGREYKKVCAIISGTKTLPTIISGTLSISPRDPYLFKLTQAPA